MDTDELAAVIGIIIACIVKRRRQRRKRGDRKRKTVVKECAKKRQKLGNMLGNVEFVGIDEIHVKEEPRENEENEDITLSTVNSELGVGDQSRTEEEPGENEENEDIILPTVKSELEDDLIVPETDNEVWWGDVKKEEWIEIKPSFSESEVDVEVSSE